MKAILIDKFIALGTYIKKKKQTQKNKKKSHTKKMEGKKYKNSGVRSINFKGNKQNNKNCKESTNQHS